MNSSHLRLSLIFGAALMLASCGVNPTSATHALEAQGMTNIKIGGYTFFGCDEKDAFRSSFTATGTNGSLVEGSVCQGFFKGTTVRFD